jgi:hypothetical protein
MHTVGLAPSSTIPLPDALDQHLPGSPLLPFGGQSPIVRDPNSTRIEGMVVPEATSAWYLSCVLHHLSNPGPPIMDTKVLAERIWDHVDDISRARWRTGDRNAAVATDLM